MAGYTRVFNKSTGDVVEANDFNNEYQSIEDAFSQAAGHRHDGTTGEGAYVPTISDASNNNAVEIDSTNNEIDFFVDVGAVKTQQIKLVDGAVLPALDNDIDLGSVSLNFKNINASGTLTVPNIIASDVDIDGGTIDGTPIGNTTPSTGYFTDTFFAGNVVPDATNTYNLGSATQEWRNLYVRGTASLVSVSAGSCTVAGSSVLTQNSDLDNLSDVATTAPAADDVLTWNGSSWAPAPAAGIGSFVSTDCVAISHNGTALENVFSSADDCVAIGENALNDLTSADHCIGIGYGAGQYITTSPNNVAIGYNALSGDSADKLTSALGRNVGIGDSVGTKLGTGYYNVAIGYGALAYSSGSASTGQENIAIGYGPLKVITDGDFNIGLGTDALVSLTTGNYNIALGKEAGMNRTVSNGSISLGYRAGRDAIGTNSIFIGNEAGFNSTNGASSVVVGPGSGQAQISASLSSITVVGADCLEGVTTGGTNTYVFGRISGQNVTSGTNNVLIGQQCEPGDGSQTNNYGVAVGFSSRAHRECVAIGYGAQTGTSGTGRNISIGRLAGQSLSSGIENTIIGHNAGKEIDTESNNTLIGAYCFLNADSASGQNTGLGRSAGSTTTTGHNVTCIGYNANASSATVSDQITLGDSSVNTLRCAATTITAVSDARDKTNVLDLEVGLDFLNHLRPVRFDWDSRDGSKVGMPDTGFLAQELEQAQKDAGVHVPQLVMNDNEDKLEASYAKLLPAMVKAIQELSAENDALNKRLEKLEALVCP